MGRAGGLCETASEGEVEGHKRDTGPGGKKRRENDRLKAGLLRELEGRMQLEDEELQEMIDAAVAGEAERSYLPLKSRLRLKKNCLTPSGVWTSCRSWWTILI